jgi:hypothetical protein
VKAVSTALAAHLAGPVTTLATCWRITRTDGVVFRFTDHNRDLVVDGEVYEASAGYSWTELYSPECRVDLGDQWCKVRVWPADVRRETAYELMDHV